MEWDNSSITTWYIVWYMADGSIQEFDLRNWRIPLPRFRSLVVTTTLAY
jgi:hypothetical protein